MSNVTIPSFFSLSFLFFFIEKKILTYNREQLNAREDGKEEEEGKKQRERNAIYPQNKYEYQARFSIFFLSFSYRFFARQRRFSRWQIRSSTAIVTFFFPFFFFLRVLIRYTTFPVGGSTIFLPSTTLETICSLLLLLFLCKFFRVRRTVV